MGLLNFILGKKESTIITDDFFGELTIDDNFCKFNRHFAPLNKAIDGSLELDNGKPNTEQKAFYALIEKEYPALMPSLMACIEKEYINWDKDFKIIDFEKEFTLVGLSLSLCNSEPINWEMSFDTIHDDNHTIFISMVNFDLEHIMIDA